MSFRSVWWYPNYTEYGTGISCQRTWPAVQEQYRRPNIQSDLRYYDLPTFGATADPLYYHKPRHLMPEHRGLFRDRPHTVARYYPGEDPAGQPAGFHGRRYYEDGPPAFKYEGARRDDLYWLERAPLLPAVTDPRLYAPNRMESLRTLNPPPGRMGGGVCDLRYSRATP